MEILYVSMYVVFASIGIVFIVIQELVDCFRELLAVVSESLLECMMVDILAILNAIQDDIDSLKE